MDPSQLLDLQDKTYWTGHPQQHIQKIVHPTVKWNQRRILLTTKKKTFVKWACDVNGGLRTQRKWSNSSGKRPSDYQDR